MESNKVHLGAIIVRDHSCAVSNYRSRMSLDQYCKQQGVIGISDLDTRAITKVRISNDRVTHTITDNIRESGLHVGFVVNQAHFVVAQAHFV